MANVEKSPSKSKAKGKNTRVRYQLFDQGLKADLLKVFKGLEPLVLEEDKEDPESLDLEGSSSDEEVEELPKDAGVIEGSKTKKGLFCGSCNVTFGDIGEQRVHYTLDWHRYNVKRKLHGQNSVGEAKFDEMIDDLSSIDGSDDEEVEETTEDNLNRLMDKLATAKTPAPSSPSQKPLTSSQKIEKSPKVHFKNGNGQVITCYKTLLTSKNDSKKGNDNWESFPIVGQHLEAVLKTPLKVTIIMASGGHFAAAVFEGHVCTLHKTFHSYTIRAKQGGSQGARDAKSGTKNCKSAGASLRRYNEQSFSDHVQDLLDSWKEHVSKSDLVFYRAISANANLLFGGRNPVFKRDAANLRRIPFVTKRPTFSEVKRVHSLLTTVHVYESMEAFLLAHTHFKKNKPSPKIRKPIDRAKSRSPKRRNSLELREERVNMSDENENVCPDIEIVDQMVDFSELKEYDDSLTPEERKKNQKKKNKKPKPEITFKLEGPIVELSDILSQQEADSKNFLTLLQNAKENENSFDINQPITIQGSTLLHAAAQKNQMDILWILLQNGCDPAIKDKSGKVAYNCAESRECRDVFRKYMGEYPDKYDYKKAQIPPPLSEEMEKERAEKKKLMNKLKREKEKQKKAEKYEKDKETEEQRRFLSLSEREKRALAAEQRILAQCKRNAEKAPVLIRCFECACDITGKVPFEYSQNLFCTTKCLAAHRKKFPVPLPV